MYSTCLFCHGSLGNNDTIETFPVGRRLAFDATKGRLWVVCPRCARWNLSPLEERWEAVEQCERAFHTTRLRASTDEVGLARLRDGMDLIRIGRPLRPEFAVWRYGRRFLARRLRRLLTFTPERIGTGSGVSVGIGAAIAAIGGVLPAAVALGLAAPVVGFFAYLSSAKHEATRTMWALSADRHPMPITAAQGMLASLQPTDNADGWALILRGIGSLRQEFAGERAITVLGMLMTYVNRAGARTGQVHAALAQLDQPTDAPSFLGHVAREVATRTGFDPSLSELPAATRLAIEMAAHERFERRAFEGELVALEQAWQEAEKIADIADNLLLPAGVSDWLVRRRRSGSRQLDT